MANRRIIKSERIDNDNQQSFIIHHIDSSNEDVYAVQNISRLNEEGAIGESPSKGRTEVHILPSGVQIHVQHEFMTQEEIEEGLPVTTIHTSRSPHNTESGNSVEIETATTSRGFPITTTTTTATTIQATGNKTDDLSQPRSSLSPVEVEEVILESRNDDKTIETTADSYALENNEFKVLPKFKQKTFYCPNCGNCYGAAGSLKLHVRACLKQKEMEEKQIEARKCNICGRIYNSISYLKEHILRHSGKPPKKCSLCYRKFIDEDKLKAHLASHETEDSHGEGEEKKVIKEYNCSFCQKKFTVIFDSRFTKRRYACDDCKEKFTNEEYLKQHKASLEEKKDFHCQKCGRKFVFEGFLQRHEPACDGTIKRKRDRVF